MKYEQQIDAAFAQLKFIPRPGQREAVSQLLVAFQDEKMQNVILNAPTGAGKSIIGAATAEALTLLRGGSDSSIKSSISLTATNVLARQYDGTFDEVSKQGKYIMIKGASNYDCSALSEPSKPENAEACAWYTMVQSGSEFDDVIQNHCNKCEYFQIKKKKNLVRHLTTNYSYFFIDRMYTGKFEDRDLLIWDEAHLVNDLFSEHNAIHFSQKKIQAMAQEIADTVRLTDLEISKILVSVAADCAKKDKINENNYDTYLNALLKVYRYAKEQGSIAGDRALRTGDMGKYSKLARFTKKYEGLACKIDDLFKYAYDHVFEYKDDEAAISVKPVFVGSMMEALQCSAHNLFMSATVSPEFMTKTLNLDAEKTKFIKLAPTFPKENKEVVFFDPLALSYSSLQNPDTVKALRKNVLKIVKKHVSDGERGIVLAPSFKLQNEIVQELQPLIKSQALKLFEHRQGEKLEHILTAFKQYKGGPAVLISPAMFEGVDLPGELSRFQILVKAPYPSLGDKRMKFILDRYPDLYQTITIMKMVQGFGRSVRSMEDHATSYCLDQNAQRLFTSSQNIWKDEFNLRFTKFL
jgi:ATP-dependent DNA helicase DinG